MITFILKMVRVRFLNIISQTNVNPNVLISTLLLYFIDLVSTGVHSWERWNQTMHCYQVTTLICARNILNTNTLAEANLM